jgi:hypothetical protein
MKITHDGRYVMVVFDGVNASQVVCGVIGAQAML